MRFFDGHGSVFDAFRNDEYLAAIEFADDAGHSARRVRLLRRSVWMEITITSRRA
jgi:hypothetical protein